MIDQNHWLKTHCGRMDQGGCSLLVKVEGNRIVGIKGDPEGALNHGYTCIKGRANPERLTHPDRLTTPLKRQGERGEGRWEPIGWEEAISTIAHTLNRVKAEHGARAVAFCQGMPKGLEHFALIRLANTFGSPNVVGPQNVCHMPREISGLHTCGFYPVVDYHYPTGCVLLWGGNPSDTNEEGVIHIQVEERLNQGTPLIVVDPRRTSMASRAQYWLQVRPGSDAALALSMLHVILFEELHDQDFVSQWTHGFDELKSYAADFAPERYESVTWVDAGLVREAARLYAQSKPAALHWGNGVEQGAHNFHICRSLLCLMAVTGNLDVPGGNIDAGQPPVAGLADFVRADFMPAKYKQMVSFAHGVIPRFMVVPPPHLRRAILHGDPYPIKAAYVHASNPVIAWSDSKETVAALKALDFLAVSEVFMTPTAALADIVLPAATQFEFNDIGHYGLGHGYILARPKVVDPPENCRPDIRIINDLAHVLGLGEYFWDDHEGMLDELLAPSGLSYAKFAEQGMLRKPVRFKKYEAKGFRTPTEKVELAISRAGQFKMPALPSFEGLPFEDDPKRPFILISSKCAEFLCSSNRRIPRLRKKRPRPLVSIHPDTACSLGIEEGDAVIIEASTGSIVQYAHIWDGVHPRVVSADHGWWYPEMGPSTLYGWDSSNLNLLTSSTTAGRAFGTPHMRALNCSLRKARPEEQPGVQMEW